MPINYKNGYLIAVRVFFAAMFGLFLFVHLSMIWTEGYQENYYTGLNIGFTFRDYLLKYPTEACLPVILLLALAGMIFKWAIGWSAGLAIILGQGMVMILYKPFSLLFIVNLVFTICFSVMMLQLRDHYKIRLKHCLWGSAFLLIWLLLGIIQEHGGLLNKKLPPAQTSVENY